MIKISEIDRMSFAERLETMEYLWRSIAAEPERLESPAWHKTIIKKRLAKIEAGHAKFLTLAQLKKRLRKRA